MDRSKCDRCHGRGFCAVCDLGADAAELAASAPTLPTTTWVEECMTKQAGAAGVFILLGVVVWAVIMYLGVTGWAS